MYRWVGHAGSLALVLLLVPVASARAQNSRGSPRPPPITPLRYVEDYSYLGDPKNRSGTWWEQFKFLPLNATGSTYLTLGDETRLRYEHYWDNEFGSAVKPDEGYLRFRELPYVGLHLGPEFQIFGQLQAAWGTRDSLVKSRFTDETGVDLLQGLAEWRLPIGSDSRLTLRGGRQVMVYGSGRLINAGPNIRTSFDGGSAQWETPNWRVDAFFVWPVLPGLQSFDDGSDDARRVWSLYATRALPGIGSGSGIDLFYIGYEDNLAAYNQGQGRERRHTFGSRIFGARGRWTWDLEGHLQLGDFAGGKIRAWSIATEERYLLRGERLSPWIGLRAAAISGDHDPSDPTLQTFNAMFPEGGYFGESGVIGPSNLLNLHSAAGLDLAAGWRLGLAAILYWRANLGDGIYGLGGNLVRAGQGSESRYIGTQADATMSWTVDRNLSFYAAFSVLWPGKFIRDTGPAETVRFLTAHAAFKY